MEKKSSKKVKKSEEEDKITHKAVSAKKKKKKKRKKSSGHSTHKHKKTQQPVKKAKSKKTQNNSIGKKIISAVSTLLFYFVFFSILVSAILVKVSDKETNVFGYRFMTVLTDSMDGSNQSEFKDGFSKGALIVLKNKDPYTLKKGDIITFNPIKDKKNVYLTHRVYEINEEKRDIKTDFITTKGDANDGTDVPISASQVTGKVILSIGSIGYLLSFLKNNILVVIVIIIALLGIVVTLKRYKNIKD